MAGAKAPPFDPTPPVVDEDGTQRWYNRAGQPHRAYDRPAVVCANGDQHWYVDLSNGGSQGAPLRRLRATPRGR